MVRDAQLAVSYTICFDETTNEKHVKELQVSIRYWSEKAKCVVFHHLETFFIGTATGDILFKHILSAIKHAELSLNDMVMLACDGPNVNKNVFNKISDKIKVERGQGLLNIGYCNLHIVHSCFEVALPSLGQEVSDLVILVHSYFDDYPSRCEAYSNVQIEKNVPKHIFLKHVSSRWLSLAKSAERLLEQWPALTHYFLQFLPRQGNSKKALESKMYKSIASALKDSTFPAQIAFTIQSAKLFERFSRIFQTEQPMIHTLYDEMSSEFALLLSKFCKPESLTEKDEFMKDSFIKNTKNLLDIRKIVIGKDAERYLSKCSKLDMLKFRKQALEHYQKAASRLFEKSILSKGAETMHLRCLQPKEIKKEKSLNSIVVYKLLKLNLDIEVDSLSDEGRLLQLEDFSTYDFTIRIDHFWQQIFKIKNFLKERKYPLITKVVKAVLPMAHGSSDVERRFSIFRNQLPADRAAMSERTFNARLNIWDGLQIYNGRPESALITKSLLISAGNAHKKHEEYLQKKRVEKENSIKRNQQEKEFEKQIIAAKNKQIEDKKKLGDLKEDCK